MTTDVLSVVTMLKNQLSTEERKKRKIVIDNLEDTTMDELNDEFERNKIRDDKSREKDV